jgi:lysophospholipase L1-like esterase
MKRFVVGALLVALVLVAVVEPAGATKRERIRRPGPRRVLLVGDSITANYQDEAAAALRAKGYEVFTEGVYYTGLLDANQCHGDQARAQLGRDDPDIVIFENVGNYAGAPKCSPAVDYGSEAFYRRWRTSARLSQRILLTARARFFWIVAPTVTYEARRLVVPKVNAIYRQIAGNRAQLIDAWTAFGGSTYNAGYHQADGLHLNQSGQNRLAALVVSAIG